MLETELPVKRKLLVLDAAWAFEAIREGNLEDSVTCRDLGGFFEHVWSVHPFASLVTSEKWTSKYGKPEHHQLNTAHTFIEGKIGRFSLLRRLPRLNFILSQVGIFFDLVHLIQKHNITIIRVGDPQYLGLFGWALSRICKIPFVVRVAANYDKIFETTGLRAYKKLFFNRNIEKIIERFVFKHADLLAAANQDNLDFALRNGARAEVSTLFRYGNLIDKRHFADPKDRTDGTLILKELGLKRGKFLLYIGRLEEIKQPSHVLYVLADIRKRGNDIKALLVGDGSLRKQLQGLAQELGVEGHVIFCGNRDQGWLSRVIPLALSVLSPYTGRALVESALGAAPIVSYDIDWHSELIQNGETGELVPFQAWEEMAEGVHRFLADSSYARSMGEAVRKRALKMMDPSILNQHERNAYIKLYDGKLLETELPVKRRLLVLVTAYSLEMIRARKLDQMITNRDLDGFFEHVWTVHPFSTIVSSNNSRDKYGFPAAHAFAPGHTFIEGKVGRFSFLKWLGPLNFLISQVGIFLVWPV